MLTPNTFGQWSQKGLDIDGGAADDRFGHGTRLSANGNTVASGAPCSGGAGSNPGYVRIFDWNNVSNTWDQKGSDINGDVNGDKFGYSVTLNGDGNTLAVGAPQNDGMGLNSGLVRVYVWDVGTNAWIQKGADINGESADDQLGWSVSLSDDGNTLIIGARYNSVLGWATGHARVYRWNNSTNSWSQLGSDLDGESEGSNAGFATSINSEGNIVAVGSPYHNGIGHVKVYLWNAVTSSWDQLGPTLGGSPTDEQYGYSIDLNKSGRILAIGSKGDCQTGQNAGHTRVYEWDEDAGVWNQKGATINGEGSWDLSGYWVSLNGAGESIAIGAAFNDGTGNDSGHLRVFDWNNGSGAWTQRGADIDGEGASDHFGWSVCLSEDGYTVAGGANANDGNGSDAGHTRVYEYPSLVGISSDDDQLIIDIFPNPTNGSFTLNANLNGEIHVSMYDVTGRIVLNERAWTNGSEMEINSSMLEKGTYSVVVDTPKRTFMETLIKH